MTTTKTDTSYEREVMQSHDEETPIEQYERGREKWHINAQPTWNWFCSIYRIHLPTEPGSPLNYWQAREARRRNINLEFHTLCHPE